MSEFLNRSAAVGGGQEDTVLLPRAAAMQITCSSSALVRQSVSSSWSWLTVIHPCLSQPPIPHREVRTPPPHTLAGPTLPSLPYL